MWCKTFLHGDTAAVAETIIYTQMNAFDLLQIYKTDKLAASKNKKILRKLRRVIFCAPSATASEVMAVDEMLLYYLMCALFCSGIFGIRRQNLNVSVVAFSWPYIYPQQST